MHNLTGIIGAIGAIGIMVAISITAACQPAPLPTPTPTATPSNYILGLCNQQLDDLIANIIQPRTTVIAQTNLSKEIQPEVVEIKNCYEQAVQFAKQDPSKPLSQPAP